MNKFKLNRKGVRGLLNSDAMKVVLKNKANAIKNRCGDGYSNDIYTGRSRPNAAVWAKSRKAKKDNSENNTILKALK